MATTSPIDKSLLTPAAAAGSLDRDHVPRLEVASLLGPHLLAVDEVAACRGVPSSPLAAGCVAPALGDDRDPAVLEHAQLAHDAVAALVLPRAARPPAQRVALDPKGIGELERLHWRVE